MAALSKEKKRKREKNQIKTILLKSIQVETSEPYEENVVQSWSNNKLCDQKGHDPKRGQAGK